MPSVVEALRDTRMDTVLQGYGRRERNGMGTVSGEGSGRVSCWSTLRVSQRLVIFLLAISLSLPLSFLWCSLSFEGTELCWAFADNMVLAPPSTDTAPLPLERGRRGGGGRGEGD